MMKLGVGLDSFAIGFALFNYAPHSLPRSRATLYMRLTHALSHLLPSTWQSCLSLQNSFHPKCFLTRFVTLPGDSVSHMKQLSRKTSPPPSAFIPWLHSTSEQLVSEQLAPCVVIARSVQETIFTVSISTRASEEKNYCNREPSA